MRVGRVSSIKFMPYRDVRMLLRYFSLKGVKLQSPKTDFTKIDRLQPSDAKNAKQKEMSQKTLNNITLDTFEKQQMDNINQINLPFRDKAEIDLIKLMMKAREGSKINTMRYMMNNSLLSVDEKRDNEKSYVDKKNESEKQENIKKYEHKDTKDINQTKNTKSMVEEYAEFLKEIDKKSQKEESKKESEKSEEF